MKKILLTVILLNCIITGAIHSDKNKHEVIENILAEETYVIPDFIINPLIDPIPH